MEEFTLRTGWKNELLNCVQEAGLSPLGFRWEKQRTDQAEENYKVSVLRHSTTKFYFKFDRRKSGGFFAKFSPGHYQLDQQTGGMSGWSDTVAWFKEWLTYLKVATAPDLWQQLQEYSPRESLVDTEHISNTPFAYLEVERILNGLDRLEDEIKRGFTLQGEQLAFVHGQISYLKERAKRHGRIDWVNISIGVVANIALTLALSPEKAKLLWSLVKSCLASILQLPAP